MRMAGTGALHAREIEGRLAAAGCVAPGDEAAQLVAAARDGTELEALVARRTAGEPLAWLVGSVAFCGIRVTVHARVYVPRHHTEPLAHRAAAMLPDGGVAVDLCTGSGAVACVLQAGAPAATVVATDLDPVAVTCARENGVDALLGHLDDPLPSAMLGAVDVMTAVVPYVPTGELPYLPRDVLAFEPRSALDGGEGGLQVLASVVARSTRWLRPGGRLLLELGGDQAGRVGDEMRLAGFAGITVFTDADGDDRAIEGRVAPAS